MDELRTLLEQFWIYKDTDKETYYKIKRKIPEFQKFLREQLGWKLIHTENLLKLEKIPAHAERFMGIQEFSDILDYAILCVTLMYLEDREEGEQFLLSELIDYIETKLKGDVQIDWTSFSQRKSLVRTLQYMEKMQMLRVYEGSSEAFGQDFGQEVLYENTGCSKYFATSFPMDISDFSSWNDFEKKRFEEIEDEKGSARMHRIYRQLVLCPVAFWDEPEHGDVNYLKHQRNWVSKNLETYLGGRLDVQKNAAFFMLEEDDCYGKVHPRNAVISEVVLLVCGQIRRYVSTGKFKKQENETISITETEFKNLIVNCQRKWKAGWSKEFREMETEKLVRTIKDYMLDWMFIREEEEEIIILPTAGKQTGFYPDDFGGNEK